jgi:ubiquinone/menaquinone biosynthesis C-methylase UbiE/DNA-binding transcriptional ArsR family regulator
MNTSPAVFDHLATLGDTTRSRLLALLEEREYAVGELQRILRLPQSTVSGHLRVLSEGGWVTHRTHGKNRFYRMAETLESDALSLWRIILQDMDEVGFRGDDRERAKSVLGARVDRSRAFFSEAATTWDEVRADLYGSGIVSFPLLALLEPDWVVADLGCGTGQLAATLAPFVERVVAVDRSPEMLDAARRRTGGRLAGLDVRRGDLEALPLDHGEANLVVINLVLHLVLDPATVLEEAFRVLSPGGRIVIVDMRAHDHLEYQEAMGHVWPGFECDQLRDWLESAGFRNVTVRPIPPDPDASGPLLLAALARKERHAA